MANILVVDDDDNMRHLMKTILERQGHGVTIAKDGLEGLARVDEKSPDLVVTDIVMPGIGGLALFSELQRTPSPPKILIVSGKRFQPDGEWTALRARGLVAFVQKPFTPAELAQSVAVLLG